MKIDSKETSHGISISTNFLLSAIVVLRRLVKMGLMIMMDSPVANSRMKIAPYLFYSNQDSITF